MIKRVVLAIVAVYVTWTAMDYLIHQVLLADTYQATAQLWRPMAEMKLGLMLVVSLVVAFVFVFIYARLVAIKSLANGLLYGFLYGLGAGLAMGFGSYATMPIPCSLALSWSLGALAEFVAAGLLVGLIVREPRRVV